MRRWQIIVVIVIAVLAVAWIGANLSTLTSGGGG